MREFNYTVSDPIGLHARPAGALAKIAKGFESEILIQKNGKAVNATKLMMLMGLGIKSGDTIKVSVSGNDEDEAAREIETFFKENL